MPAPVVDSVLDLVGETPVVRLRKLSPEGGATIWGKCEHLNPGGSVKDRICLAMIEAAKPTELENTIAANLDAIDASEK